MDSKGEVLWSCQTVEGRLPFLTCLAMGLFVVFPFICWVLDTDMFSALLLAVGLSIVAWLNVTFRRRKEFVLYEACLVEEELPPTLGASRKVYPLEKMKGQRVRVSSRSPLGVCAVVIGEGRQALRFELFDREQAAQLAMALKDAISLDRNSSTSSASNAVKSA